MTAKDFIGGMTITWRKHGRTNGHAAGIAPLLLMQQQKFAAKLEDRTCHVSGA
jgi:hypothetical protein